MAKSKLISKMVVLICLLLPTEQGESVPVPSSPYH